MRLRGRSFDIALAALLTASTQVELLLADGVEGSRAVQHASFALLTGSLAARRSRPLLSATGVSAGMTAQTALAGTAPVLGGLIAAIIATYSVAAHTSGRRRAAGAVVIAVGVIGSGLVHEESRTLADFAGNLLIFGVLFALGLVLGHRRDRTDELARDLETERLRGERALAEERSRIARELHDVIAHHVSAMTLQAGAARQVLARDPERVREPLEVVEEHGRRAMDEMRRLLGILREDPAAPNGHAQPSLRGLEDLAAQVRRTGFDVQVHTHGEVVALPAGVDLAAYRIVQEALTNALRHSSGTRATVDVTYGTRQVEISVCDDGTGRPAPSEPGHGLIGMRERAALYGGSLDAGPDPGGGFRVAARLPLDPVAAA